MGRPFATEEQKVIVRLVEQIRELTVQIAEKSEIATAKELLKYQNQTGELKLDIQKLQNQLLNQKDQSQIPILQGKIDTLQKQKDMISTNSVKMETQIPVLQHTIANLKKHLEIMSTHSEKMGKMAQTKSLKAAQQMQDFGDRMQELETLKSEWAQMKDALDNFQQKEDFLNIHIEDLEKKNDYCNSKLVAEIDKQAGVMNELNEMRNLIAKKFVSQDD